MSYVYLTVREPGCSLYVVGHYDPAGAWHPESDHSIREDAAARVHWLNGGRSAEDVAASKIALNAFQKAMDKLNARNPQEPEPL